VTDISEKNSLNMGQKCGCSANLDVLAEKWPSPFVARERFQEFSWGLFKGNSMNRMYSRGDGINVRYSFGERKVFYEVSDAIKWLKSKIKGQKNV
jgi:hypothetical protein